MEVESRYIKSLLHSAKAGNNSAIEQLLEINLDRIYTISHRLNGNQKDAEALTCKTLVEAWKILDKIRNDVPFNLWLEGLNVHLALQDLRDVKVENKKRGFFKRKKPEVKEPDPKISELDAEICKLPKTERTVFVLSKIENYSPDELSGMMDISQDKIREKLESSESLLLKADFIQTPEMLKKRMEELPKKIKADKQILKNALGEIYKIKLKNRAEEEQKEEVIEKTEKDRQEVIKQDELKSENVKIKKETGIEIPSMTPGFKKGLGWTLTTIAIFISAYYIITSVLNGWEVSQQSGTVTLAGVQIKEGSALSTDEILKTKENSAAKILIPNVGNINIESNSELKRVDKKNTAELIEGKINVDCSSAEELFNLRVPSSIISNKHLSSIYTVEVKPDKSGQISVKSGLINITYKNKEAIAGSNFYVEFDEKLGVSVPFHKNSNTEFITAVREFLLTGSEIHVERIVSLSTELNALTLWNLFRFINPAKRLLVYRKLNELVPHSSEITHEDVLNLNSEKLQLWLKDIEKKI